MPKPHLKTLGLTVLISILVQVSSSKNHEDLIALAKRSLLERERNFFKTKPMSDELRSFIERTKRQENKMDEKRKKRSEKIDENLLYVIQNGQLIPFKNMKSYKRSEAKKTEPEGYTVVPLVIPIGSKTLESKLVKTRTLDENLQDSQAKNDGGNSQDSAIPSSTKSTETASISDGGNAKSEELSDEGPGDNSTKDENQVLHKILEDVEGLMQWKHEGNKKEGVICNLNGSWISDAAGMRFDIVYKNSTRKKFRIHVADRIPPNEDGFLCDGNWSVYGEIPFLHSGMVIALAVHEKDKHIATFIGECRICEGSESVTGTWLIGRSSRDCKDQKASHKILSDVWKKEQAHTLRKKHLQEIGVNLQDED